MAKPKLTLVHDEQPKGPSASFVAIGRNVKLKPPVRFEPTIKRDGDIVI